MTATARAFSMREGTTHTVTSNLRRAANSWSVIPEQLLMDKDILDRDESVNEKRAAFTDLESKSARYCAPPQSDTPSGSATSTKCAQA